MKEEENWENENRNSNLLHMRHTTRIFLKNKSNYEKFIKSSQVIVVVSWRWEVKKKLEYTKSISWINN